MIVLMEAGDVLIQEDGEIQIITEVTMSAVFDIQDGLLTGSYDWEQGSIWDAMTRFADGHTVLDLSDGEGGLWSD